MRPLPLIVLTLLLGCASLPPAPEGRGEPAEPQPPAHPPLGLEGQVHPPAPVILDIPPVQEKDYRGTASVFAGIVDSVVLTDGGGNLRLRADLPSFGSRGLKISENNSTRVGSTQCQAAVDKGVEHLFRIEKTIAVIICICITFKAISTS